MLALYTNLTEFYLDLLYVEVSDRETSDFDRHCDSSVKGTCVFIQTSMLNCCQINKRLWVYKRVFGSAHQSFLRYTNIKAAYKITLLFRTTRAGISVLNAALTRQVHSQQPCFPLSTPFLLFIVFTPKLLCSFGRHRILHVSNACM